jgi:hypothetical protein
MTSVKFIFLRLRLHIPYGLLIYSMRATYSDTLTLLDLMAVRTSFDDKKHYETVYYALFSNQFILLAFS